MSEENELMRKMRTMPKEELMEYMHISNVSGRACNIVGIGMILMALIFTNVFTICLAAAVVYIAGQIACGVDDLKNHIDGLMKAKINS